MVIAISLFATDAPNYKRPRSRGHRKDGGDLARSQL